MKNIIFSILLFSTSIGFSQTSNQLHLWSTYSGNHTLNQDWSIHTLYSWRRSDFVNQQQQSLLRLGLNRHYNNKLIFSVGYDWVITFPYGEQPIDHKTTEHRIFEQLILKNRINHFNVNHRYRLEQRFSNNVTKHRLRYRLTTTVPIIKSTDGKTSLYFACFDEVFINLNHLENGHYFDQNWIYFGLGYPFKNGLTLKLGYMNQYVVKGDNSHIENNHTPQLGLSYNIDFTKQ